MIDTREPRASQQFVLERFHIRSRAFGEHFDATVVEVPHIANNLMPRRRTLREKAITHALDVAADEELPSNWRYIH